MAKKNVVRVTPSTGNVFRDLGFSKEESEHLLVRADLLIQVQKAIASRRLKQAEAAKVLRVTQPRVSDLLRGRIDLFSTDALIDMLASLGVGVRLRAEALRLALSYQARSGHSTCQVARHERTLRFAEGERQGESSGGGGSRTRVREHAVAGVYMRSRS